jgi:hypothetical protein
LEEQREKKFDHFARVLQKAFKKYFNQQKLLQQKEDAAGKTFPYLLLSKQLKVIKIT